MVTALILAFVLGYIAITSEKLIRINKTAAALLTGVICWTIYIISSPDREVINESLLAHLGDISSILFFLLGAMTIVELIDANNGFNIIIKFINQSSKRKLLWMVGFLAFFLSAILDNLTTTIVMISILRKLLNNKNDRMFFAGIIVIAANAGGAWTPIGDVTTTMLWIGGQVTPANIMWKLIFPSLISLVVPLILASFTIKGTLKKPTTNLQTDSDISKRDQTIILVLGVVMLLMVPVFKTVTHLPPFMGMLLGVGILWVYTEFKYKNSDFEKVKSRTLVHALHKIDMSNILFFLGILMAVAALESADILHDLNVWLTDSIGNLSAIVMSIGVISAIIDNVPLVAAVQGMFDLHTYPADSYIWEFLAYCAGTGGSILIIGSAAGVAAMGMEKIDFFWYVKKISWLALIGYFAGAFSYMLIENIFYM